MTIVFNLVLVTHLLGMAALIGGYAVAQPKVSEVMVWGARAQIVTGLILMGLGDGVGSLHEHQITAKMIVKLVIAVGAATAAELGRADAKRGKDVAMFVHAAGWLGILNVFVAALWH